MLAQEIFAVIVSIGSANDDNGCDLCKASRIAGTLDPLMVELNDDNGAVDPVVECAVLVHAPHPSKVGLAQMPLDLFHLYFSVT